MDSTADILTRHRRRPVMARLTYGATIIMAILYLAGVATARSLAAEVDSAGAVTWQWLLLLGGVTGMTGAILGRTRWWRGGTHLESLGAMLTAIEVAIYIVVVGFSDTLSRPPWATIIWIGGVIPAGLLWRAWEAQQDRDWREALEAVADQVEAQS